MILTKEKITFSLRPAILGVRLNFVDVGLVILYLGGGVSFFRLEKISKIGLKMFHIQQ